MAAAYGISLLCMQKVDEVGDFYREFARVKNYLASSRPTAVNLFTALERMEVALLKCQGAGVEVLKSSLAGRGRGDSERRRGGVPENWRTWIVTVETEYGLAHAL